VFRTLVLAADKVELIRRTGTRLYGQWHSV
jgi:hypothetical protein